MAWKVRELSEKTVDGGHYHHTWKRSPFAEGQHIQYIDERCTT